MSFIQQDNPKDIQILSMNGFPMPKYNMALSAINQANDNYYRQSETHELFYKMLCLNDTEIGKDPDFRFMQPDEKQDWLKIRNLKTGDRSFINRYLVKELKEEIPSLFAELIEEHVSEHSDSHLSGLLSISSEIDTLLLSTSVPAYFRYLEQITTYKKGIFSKLRRGYISYLQVKAINVICHFLKAFESDLTIINEALLRDHHVEFWPKIGSIIGELCDRSDPHHHDQISLYAINCLRSIYVSLFNIAVNLALSGKQVPTGFRKLLPIIPDKIEFSREKLIAEDAWDRYQDHLFLFQNIPEEQSNELEAFLLQLLPAQRVVWIGSLGKGEIQQLVLPILARGDKFEKLTLDCQKIPPADGDNITFVNRVKDVLGEIYIGYLKRKKTVSKRIHSLFAHLARTKKAFNGRTEPIDLKALKEFSFLVVDDSSRIRQMTIDVLKKAGISKIVSADDGDKAWDLIQTNQVDVILCDWIMPNLSGIELVQKIMQVESLASKITFVMLTTVNNKASIVEALSVGVRGYLIKPFSQKQLLEKVYFATEWLRKEQQAATFMTGNA